MEIKLTYIRRSDRDFKKSNPLLISWIGRNYYRPSSFIKEAQKFGFSRAIPHSHFSKEMIGAKILFLARGRGKKHKVIAEGIVDGVIVPPEITQKALSEGLVVKTSDANVEQKRGCGVIIFVGSYSVFDWEGVEKLIKNTSCKIFLKGHLIKNYSKDNVKAIGIYPTRLICWAVKSFGERVMEKPNMEGNLVEYDSKKYKLK